MLLSEEMDEILPAIVLATQLDGGRGRQRAVLPLTCGREAPRAHTSAEPRRALSVRENRTQITLALFLLPLEK
jgi:hypothetical protein